MEQIFFLVLVGAVALLRFALQAAEKRRNAETLKRVSQKPAAPNAPVQRAPADSEEERIRKFMEALGVPTTNAPPPKPRRRESVPKTPRAPARKILPVDPFPAPRTVVAAEPVVTAAPPAIISTPEPVAPLVPQVAVTAPAAPQQISPTFEVADIRWGNEDPAQTLPTSGAPSLVSPDASAAEQSWATRLASPASLRDAVILREIFGPPRSLQPETGVIAQVAAF